jgi:hypothetical protein
MSKDTLTVGVAHGVAAGSDAAQQLVYVELGGYRRMFRPGVARRFADTLRSSSLPDLVEIAAEIDRLALEIETAGGAA